MLLAPMLRVGSLPREDELAVRAALAEAFHRVHEARYGHCDRTRAVELVAVPEAGEAPLQDLGEVERAARRDLLDPLRQQQVTGLELGEVADVAVDAEKRTAEGAADVGGAGEALDQERRPRDRPDVEQRAALRVMRDVGIERMIFGSDGPHVMLQPYLEQVLRLPLTEEERRLILSENAKRIYRFGS